MGQFKRNYCWKCTKKYLIPTVNLDRLQREDIKLIQKSSEKDFSEKNAWEFKKKLRIYVLF